MLPIIPRTVKKLWDAWDLRVFMTTSLVLQAFLLILAPFRQRSRSNMLSRSVWASYLLADWVAAVAIGQITKSLGDPGDPEGNDDLFALWASFLLMHLGGPDGITSLSLEDNELWIRHLFGLLLQVGSAAYSLYLTLSKNQLWFPTILVFIGGSIKFSERTLALRRASLDHFGMIPLTDPGLDYQEAEQAYSTMRSVQVQGSITEMMISTMSGGVSNFGSTENMFSLQGPLPKNFDEMKLLEVAYSFFGTFKGLIVGFLLSSKDRESSRSYFLHETADRAFRLVEYELSFMYQFLHTKAVVIHGKLGYFLRIITICSTVSAFLMFFFIEKHGFGKFEIGVTYALFIGAIVLDTISACFLIISDWVLLAVKDKQIIRHVPKCIIYKRRWSGSVSQKDIISHCLTSNIGARDLTTCVLKYGILKTMKMAFCNFSYWKTVDSDLRNCIFNELQKKSKKVRSLSDAIEACSYRGEGALLENSASYIKFKWSIGEFHYSESLLLWHLATELCYSQDNSSIADQEAKGYANRNENPPEYKKICKILSDYMFDLLVNKSVMLAPVLGNWKIVFRDTCTEAISFFDKHQISDHVEACTKILSLQPKVRSTTLKGDQRKSVFIDACILAQQLQKEKSSQRWEMMRRVWVEMLSYAAINCRPFVHAQELSKGGELLTFTWLLMNHLGLGTQFTEQQAGTKMVTII